MVTPFPIPASFSVSRVNYSFDDEGNPTDPHDEKRFIDFRAELLWFTEAIAAQKKKDFVKDKIA